MFPHQVKWRRHLHQYPEISNQEFATTKFIREQLTRHKVSIIPARLKTGLAAVIKGKGRRTVAIRADIDALSVCEINKIPFKSRHEGIMHACGHDVHTAIALGTAAILNDWKNDLKGTVKIFFQPAEESPPGGAESMIKAGLLANPKVDMIFALHVDPTLPVGEISLRDGPTMASVTDFDIIVEGRGCHAARPHLGVDAIAVAAELIDSLQKVVSREIDPMATAVITFGTIRGGTARNVISDRVNLQGTARTLSQATRKALPSLIRRTAQGVARARGAKIQVNLLASYPVVENHAAANRILKKTAEDLIGSRAIKVTPQVMGGEDFAFFLQKVPGAMFRLGVKNSRIGADKGWHAPDFMVDEEAIFYGTAMMTAAVMNFLDGGD